MNANSQESNIDNYIKAFPQEVRETLRILQKTIIEEIPDAEETISYGMPTYKLNGKYVVYFAAYKKHISLYPISAATVKSLRDGSSYKLSGKGTIQFPVDKPLPVPLIRKIVKQRVIEYQKRQEK